MDFDLICLELLCTETAFAVSAMSPGCLTAVVVSQLDRFTASFKVVSLQVSGSFTQVHLEFIHIFASEFERDFHWHFATSLHFEFERDLNWHFANCALHQCLSEIGCLGAS